jgi:hypothetical protein
MLVLGLAAIIYAVVYFPKRSAPVVPPIPPPAPATMGLVGHLLVETPVQRFLRTQAEWRRLDQIARDEKTPARLNADAAFREYMEAQAVLEREATKQ